MRRCLGVKRVGHLGTLDPAASGVLPVAVGQATRLIELVRGDKAYRAEVVLGIRTDTLDAEGRVTKVVEPVVATREQVEELLPSFVGRVQQVPPMASALHHQGRRLYELFREGREIELAPREVEIRRIVLLGFESPRATLQVECGAGTYIRSLARDIGERLGCGAHLASLVRTQSGPFAIEEAMALDWFEAQVAGGRAASSMAFPLRRALAHVPWWVVRPEAVARVCHGGRIGFREVEDNPVGAGTVGSPSTPGVCILADPAGAILAVAHVTRATGDSSEPPLEWQPTKVLAVGAPSQPQDLP